MAEEERKAISGFFAVFLGCGRRVEYATLVHKDIFEAAPVQRIWGLKKDTGKKEFFHMAFVCMSESAP